MNNYLTVKKSFINMKIGKKVFDITPYSSEWAVRGKWVQATFWKLKLEDVKKVKFLHTGVRKKSSN